MPYDNLIIDMNHLASRVRHVFSLSHNGVDVSVTYGVIKNIESLLKKFHPKSVIFCQDGGFPEYRAKAVPAYKTGRDRGDPNEYQDYIRQLNVLAEVFKIMGIVCIRKIGAEADDICYHASRILIGKSLVVSGDHDLLQCINIDTDVYIPSKDIVVTVDNFKEVIGIPLSNYVDYCALIGDGADNISGVYGVGPVTATKLFEAFKDLSGIYNAANSHSPIGDIREKIADAIIAFGWDRLVKNVYTMALYADRVGARQAIINEIANYRPVSKQATKKWLLSNAFVSLLELPNALTVLVAPQIKVDIFRCPVVSPRKWPVL